MRRAIDTVRNEPETAAIRTLNLVVLAGEIRKLATAIHQEAQSALSEDLSRWAAKLEATARGACQRFAFRRERHRRDPRQAGRAARAARGASPSAWTSRSCCGSDRNLLSIGYRVEERQLDESCYDLLASEARLASLFAIAKGDIPTNTGSGSAGRSSRSASAAR